MSPQDGQSSLDRRARRHLCGTQPAVWNKIDDRTLSTGDKTSLILEDVYLLQPNVKGFLCIANLAANSQ
eukprot:1176406-Prorocentrum_minimum.AAC.2